MNQSQFLTLAILTFAPLLINGIFDAFTGYLFRPLSDFAIFTVIFGSLSLCCFAQLHPRKIIIALMTMLLILSMLQVIAKSAKRAKTGIGALGQGDYRVYAATSYLCALHSVSSAFIAVMLSGCIMLLIFGFIRGKNFFTDPKILSAQAISENLPTSRNENSFQDQLNQLYRRKRAPMGLPIVISAGLVVFGQIAQI
ncbi:hypothetical protein [Arcanobacterium hippocoleae]|uniref:hypothetical protein n=1 Tax=Arcanobacterium hippocoleae TaxID=149017 RepID=UPI00333EB52D